MTFDPISTDREEARELYGLRHGSRSVCDYAIDFQTLAAESGWNQAALYDILLKGLSPPIQDRLPPVDLPLGLDSLIALTRRMNNRTRVQTTAAVGDQSDTKMVAAPNDVITKIP